MSSVQLRSQLEKAGLGWSVLSEPAGPVALAFMNDLRPMTFIMGPVGSAKTTSCVGKCINIVRAQQPSISDGVRKARIGVIRQDYRRLWESTIPSYFDVLPKELGKWHGGQGEPAEHLIRWKDPVSNKVLWEIEFLFRAIGDHNLEDFIRGLQVTAFWLNEADLLPAESLGFFFQRVGRFNLKDLPDPETAVKCVFGDFNAPDEDNWLAQKLEETENKITRADIDRGYKPPNFISELEKIDISDLGAVRAYMENGAAFYLQPSGFSPYAENIQNLGSAWYPMQAAQFEDWQIKRFIENKIGFSRTGEPVYRDYNPELHDAPEDARANPRTPVVVGIDGGGTPAAVVMQQFDGDRLIVLDEVVTPKDQRSDGFNFGKQVGEFLVSQNRGYVRHVESGMVYLTIDPANEHGGFEAGDTFLEAFEKGYEEATGMRLRVVPAETNDPDTRAGAVRRCLREMVGGRARKVISRRCMVLRRAYASGYKLKKSKNAVGDIVYQPVKNEYSHVADADQYATLWFVGIGADQRRESRMSGVGLRMGEPVKPPKSIYRRAI